MKEKLKSIAFFTKMWWYALWGWAAVLNTEFQRSVPDKYGDGINTHWTAKIHFIDTTTKQYLLKKLSYKLKQLIKSKEEAKWQNQELKRRRKSVKSFLCMCTFLLIIGLVYQAKRHKNGATAWRSPC